MIVCHLNTLDLFLRRGRVLTSTRRLSALTDISIVTQKLDNEYFG